MVFTHLPSAVFLALIPIPNNVQLSIVFLFLRSSLQAMSIAPRSAFIAAIVLPEERTVMMGLVNVVRTTAQSLAPLITGVLVENGLFWTAFVAAGSLRVCYDMGCWVCLGTGSRKGGRARMMTRGGGGLNLARTRLSPSYILALDVAARSSGRSVDCVGSRPLTNSSTYIQLGGRHSTMLKSYLDTLTSPISILLGSRSSIVYSICSTEWSEWRAVVSP